MAARSAPHSVARASLTGVDNVERSIAPFHKTLDARFRARQLAGGGAETFDAFLEQRERARQRHAVTLQLGGNGLQARHPLLERHGLHPPRTCATGGLRTTDGTTPSRTTRSNAVDSVN